MSSIVALYGGSFDPIHNGHLIVARAVAEQLGTRRVVFLPAAKPPHKEGQRLTDPDHRAEMVRLAIGTEPGFEFSDFDLTRNGPTFTIDTVDHFQSELGSGVEVCWIIGADSLAELATWHRAPELVDRCRIITAVRAGWEKPNWEALAKSLSDSQITKVQAGVLETPTIEISATDIRRRIAEGKSIRYSVPDPVRTYIQARWLYRK